MSESTPESRSVTRIVSPEEREEAVRKLTVAFADDAISVTEFESRVAAVYEAESSTALVEITRDLPAASTTETNVPAPIERPTAVTRRAEQRLSSFLSAVERDLDGPVPERLDVRSVMGSLELDLRRAEFPPGVTEIRVDAIMGNIEVELPKYVRVENEGHAFLGSFSVKGRSKRDRDGDAPVVRITGRSVMSNVEVDVD